MEPSDPKVVDPSKIESSDSPGATAILLIDDNAVQAATRQTILRRAGYFVIAIPQPRSCLGAI